MPHRTDAPRPHADAPCGAPACLDPDCETAPGRCHCGCGRPAPVARMTDRRWQCAKGKARLFIRGHQPHPDDQGRGWSGEKHYNWQGGRSLTSDGYVSVYVGPDHPMANNKGRVREHRLVMAEAIGRMLRPEEVVHHMLECEGGSGDKTDNRIEVLMLFATQAEHVAHHLLVERQAT